VARVTSAEGADLTSSLPQRSDVTLHIGGSGEPFWLGMMGSPTASNPGVAQPPLTRIVESDAPKSARNASPQLRARAKGSGHQ
jgi:hypothetical protein